MADNIDVATEHDAILQKANLQAALKATEPKLLPNGLCHNCLEVVEDKKLFCDLDCSYDYEVRRKKSQR
mgnify:CR=1 FL=1